MELIAILGIIYVGWSVANGLHEVSCQLNAIAKAISEVDGLIVSDETEESVDGEG